MKKVEEIAKIREDKKKELSLRINKSSNTRRKAYFSMPRNRMYIF